MRYLALLLCGFLLSLNSGPISAADDAAANTRKLYPPYPDVWGLDLPIARQRESGRCGNPDVGFSRLYLMQTGELRFLGFVVEDTTTAQCRGGKIKPFFVDFFQQSVQEVSEREYNEFVRANRHLTLPLSRLDAAIEIGTERSIQAISTGTSGKCPEYKEHMVKMQDVTLQSRSMYLYQVLDIQQRASIDDCNPTIKLESYDERVVNRRQNIHALSDGTLITWGYGSPSIFRLTSDLNSRFVSRHKLYWIDSVAVDGWQIEKITGPNRQKTQENAVFEFLNNRR